MAYIIFSTYINILTLGKTHFLYSFKSCVLNESTFICLNTIHIKLMTT